MNKWSILQNSTVARVAASTTTLVAGARLCGAGGKW